MFPTNSPFYNSWGVDAYEQKLYDEFLESIAPEKQINRGKLLEYLNNALSDLDQEDYEGLVDWIERAKKLIAG